MRANEDIISNRVPVQKRGPASINNSVFIRTPGSKRQSCLLSPVNSATDYSTDTAPIDETLMLREFRLLVITI